MGRSLPCEQERRALKGQERAASVYEAGRRQGLRQYRDAFAHYHPGHGSYSLNRHFLEAFPYAWTEAPLSPLLPFADPAFVVVEDNYEEFTWTDSDEEFSWEGSVEPREGDSGERVEKAGDHLTSGPRARAGLNSLD